VDLTRFGGRSFTFEPTGIYHAKNTRAGKGVVQMLFYIRPRWQDSADRSTWLSGVAMGSSRGKSATGRGMMCPVAGHRLHPLSDAPTWWVRANRFTFHRKRHSPVKATARGDQEALWEDPSRR